jgi:hypothetical protein
MRLAEIDGSQRLFRKFEIAREFASLRVLLKRHCSGS